MIGGTAWKLSEYRVFSSPYFPVFRPEKTPYLDTFHTMLIIQCCVSDLKQKQNEPLEGVLQIICSATVLRQLKKSVQ